MATFFSVGTSMADLGVPGVWGVLEQLGVPGVPGVREAQLGGVPGVMAVEPGVVGVEVPLFPVLLRIGSDPTCKKKEQHQTHRNTAPFPSTSQNTSLCAKRGYSSQMVVLVRGAGTAGCQSLCLTLLISLPGVTLSCAAELVNCPTVTKLFAL